MAKYQIQIKSELAADWLEWFGDFEMRIDEKGDTVLVGNLADQSALFGVLKKIHDLGLVLIAVKTLTDDD
jgi:hypothetical protein